MVNNPRVKESMFLAWMEKNKDDPFVRTLTYSQFPNYFTFVREKRIWKLRERGFLVGRLDHCTPAQGELYYLRLLLTKITDASKEAAGLAIIQQLLLRNGRTLNGYPSMPKYDNDLIIDTSVQLILQELNYNKEKEIETSNKLQRLMTEEQKKVYDEIIGSVSSKRGGFFFVHGFGGTGKTFIWNSLTASVRANGGIILNVASSGIAATLLPSGRTTHSRFWIPHHKLVLKVGVPVMLIRNIDQASGLCNGTRLQITQFGKNVIKAKALNETSVGEDILIHRMDMNPSECKLPFTLTRRQFPIIISFAMTINKIQGQSMTNVGLYLPPPVFSHGQLYVVLFRVKSFNGLKLLILDEFNKCSNTTTNVVYREVFQNLSL
ncbi:hypothetical protein K1719_025048 [Acacia pycnantha]|nr:hypothetical protein K1719_025048 [Acacia pycnantha]